MGRGINTLHELIAALLLSGIFFLSNKVHVLTLQFLVLTGKSQCLGIGLTGLVFLSKLYIEFSYTGNNSYVLGLYLPGFFIKAQGVLVLTLLVKLFGQLQVEIIVLGIVLGMSCGFRQMPS